MTNVTSQAAAAQDALREIKPPIAIVNVWLWVAIGAVALVLAAIAIGLILYFVLRKKQVVLPPPVPPHLRAKQKLKEALELDRATESHFASRFPTRCVFTLEERFKFHAPERTTEEFLYELQATNRLLPDQKESLGEFLKRCDLVKFAQYEPREIELRELHDSAVRLVEETEPPPAHAGIDNRTGTNGDPGQIGNRQSQIANRE